MKLIGLLGGMSWQSTAEYYRILNELAAARLGGLHSARCLLYSVDFAGIEEMQAGGRWADAARELTDAARALEAGGADFVVLCTNTMHKVAGEIGAGLSIPLLHLGDATATAVKAAGVGKVGLLGTGFTMSEGFYTERIASHGLEVLVPDEADQRVVHDIIYGELCRGVVREESRAVYREVIARLVERGAGGVIYGCTEIELLVGQADSAVPVFATTRLHCEAAAELAMGEVVTKTGPTR
ncbi:aspartate/glutamate racemase family protein [Phytomonospora sp. NPDC050363]|uniref:aspartate/glutamate racemase family protein n=1 Tax=Phytomonospora sp. NPDC050363 TaxID=3155642 RepID=UPI0033DCE661